MTEVIEQSKEIAVAGGDLTALIQTALTSNEVTPEKLHSLLDFQERVMGKQAEVAFNEAMARLQPRIPQIEKKAKAHNNKHAKLEDIDTAIRPLYTAEGFSISYDQRVNDDKTKTYIAYLSHQMGHRTKAEITLPDDTGGSKNAVQAVASTVSYARRYLIKMLFNIIERDEDDDGNAAGGVITEDQAAKLKDLLKETGSNVKAFLDLFGAASVDEIPAKEFRKANALLLAKRETLKGGKDD